MTATMVSKHGSHDALNIESTKGLWGMTGYKNTGQRTCSLLSTNYLHKLFAGIVVLGAIVVWRKNFFKTCHQNCLTRLAEIKPVHELALNRKTAGRPPDATLAKKLGKESSALLFGVNFDDEVESRWIGDLMVETISGRHPVTNHTTNVEATGDGYNIQIEKPDNYDEAEYEIPDAREAQSSEVRPLQLKWHDRCSNLISGNAYSKIRNTAIFVVIMMMVVVGGSVGCWIRENLSGSWKESSVAIANCTTQPMYCYAAELRTWNGTVHDVLASCYLSNMKEYGTVWIQTVDEGFRNKTGKGFFNDPHYLVGQLANRGVAWSTNTTAFQNILDNVEGQELTEIHSSTKEKNNENAFDVAGKLCLIGEKSQSKAVDYHGLELKVQENYGNICDAVRGICPLLTTDKLSAVFDYLLEPAEKILTSGILDANS